MKRTSFAFAMLTAIILLSCSSHDNSNSSADDLNFSQTPILKKVSPSDEVQASSNLGGQITPNATGTKTVNCGTMSITKPYPFTGWSSEAVCDFTSFPAGSTIARVEFIISMVTGSIGTFSITSLRLQCGTFSTDIAWNGSPTTISTTAFAGYPTNTRCYLSFYGKCNGAGTGGASCSVIYRVNANVLYSY